MNFVAYYDGWTQFAATHATAITTRATIAPFKPKYDQAKQLLAKMDTDREAMASTALAEHQAMSDEAHAGSATIDQDADLSKVAAEKAIQDREAAESKAAADARAAEEAQQSPESAARHAGLQEIDQLNDSLAQLEAQAKEEFTDKGLPVQEGLQADIDGLKKHRDELADKISRSAH